MSLSLKEGKFPSSTGFNECNDCDLSKKYFYVFTNDIS